jgi:hypothetical protein
MNIPDYCYTLDNMTINPKTKVGKIIRVVALVSGFYKTNFTGTQEDVNAMNENLGVTRAQEEAMSTGSMFGWELYPNTLKRFEEIFSKQEEK